MEKKKRVKFNIIDVAVLLVVILVIWGASVKFGKYNVKTNESSEETIVYTMEIANVRDYSLQAYQSGDMVFDSLTGVNIGTIQKIEASDAVNYENRQDGKLVKVVNPYKKDIVLYIETPGTVENNAYYANKSIELKVNSQKAIETKYVKTTGIISNITVE
jgi:hypothetical protein